MLKKDKHTSLLIDKIKKNGYVVVPNLLSNKDCEKYCYQLDKYSKKYLNKYANPGKVDKFSLQAKNFERTVYNLHNKNINWFKIFENKTVLKVLDILLKEGSYKNSEPYYLNNISARSPAKNSPSQQIHIDGGLPGVNYYLRVNALWCLNDFNKINGTTSVIPGSQKKKSYPKDGKKDYKNIKHINARAGSVIIFCGSLWHGGSSKVSDKNRWGVILGYSRWWIKPSFDFQKNTPKKIFDKLKVSQKKLLGFNLIPPKDEFSRVRRISDKFEKPFKYHLPK